MLNCVDSHHLGVICTAIQAIVSKVVPTYFMRVLGQNSTTISVQAVAQTSTTTGSVGGCIFVLDPSSSGAFTVDGNVILTTSCGAVVDSTSSSAFTMVGNSTIDLANGAEVGVVGPGVKGDGWSISGGGTLTNTTSAPQSCPSTLRRLPILWRTSRLPIPLL